MSQQNYEDITGFRIWPWGTNIAQILPDVPEEATCAQMEVAGFDNAEELLDKFEITLAERSSAAQFVNAEGPLHRFDATVTLGHDYPHLTWYEELLEFPVRIELRFLAIQRPVLSQAAIIPKTVYKHFEADLPHQERKRRTKEFLEQLCTRYEMVHQILTEKYGRPRRSSYGTEQHRYWEAVWERPSGAVQLLLGGTHCPYDFWISYCPKKHVMIADEKAQEAYRKL